MPACASAPRTAPAAAVTPGPPQTLAAAPPAGAGLTAADLLEREGRAALATGDAVARKTVDDQRRAVLATAVEKDRMEAADRISDEDVRRYYEEHPAEFDQPERLMLRHIFKRVPREAPAEERQKVRREMESILERLRQGAEFGQLAQAESDSETAGHGGQILPSARGGLPPAIDSVVWALKPGQLSEIISTAIGFHVFRLESILPASKTSLEDARESIHRKLTALREREAREALFQELLRESGAAYDPAPLRKRPIEGDPVLFVLGQTRVTLKDVVDQWKTLPFDRQRLEGLEDVLRERARTELYAWQAARGTAQHPEVARDVAAAEKQALVDRAYERRLSAKLRGPREREVAAYFQENRGRFGHPRRLRLWILSRRYPDDHVPYAAYEELLALARQIRSGARDFASAARELSDDPSGLDGGSLGWVTLIDFASWAGFEAGNKVTLLKPGTVSDPMLIEVYQPERMRHRRDGYMLVLVEDMILPTAATSLDEVRDRVEREYALRHASELRTEIEAEVRARR